MSYPTPSPLAVKAAELINHDRIRLGRAVLKLDARLSYCADQHSKAMAAAQKIWDPTDSELRSYVKGMPWSILGANAGETSYDADQVATLHSAFMHSKVHWANIENKAFTRVGIGFRSKNNVTFETQIFFG